MTNLPNRSFWVRIMISRSHALCLLLLSALVLCGRTLAAADGISVTISPLNAEIAVKAGNQVTGVISVTNNCVTDRSVLVAPASDDPTTAHLKVFTSDWSLDQKGNISFQPAGAAPDSCSNWIEINPSMVSVPAGQAVDVRYTVTAPSSASGTYHTLIIFQQISDSSNGQRAAGNISGRIGSALYVNVGSMAKRARISDFRVDAKTASITIQNTGTTIVRLKGTLSISDDAGKQYQTVPIPGALILPGPNGQRQIDIALPAALEPGHSIATAIIDYGADVLLGAKCSAPSD
jgi:hypothetical protein